MILKNHGAVTVGRTVAEAVVTMYQLERAAYAHVMAGKDLAVWEPDETYLRFQINRINFSGAPGTGAGKRWRHGALGAQGYEVIL